MSVPIPARYYLPRESIPTWFFALAVVRYDERFLLVHERNHGELWYLPAGRAERGEDLIAAACRETLEETGVSIRLTGIIRIEHTPRPDSARVRVIFAGVPVADTRTKSIPDAESLAQPGSPSRSSAGIRYGAERWRKCCGMLLRAGSYTR